MTSGGSPREGGVRSGTGDAEAVLDQAITGGDPHAIKFADAAVEAWQHGHDPELLAAAVHNTELISPGRRS